MGTHSDWGTICPSHPRATSHFRWRPQSRASQDFDVPLRSDVRSQPGGDREKRLLRSCKRATSGHSARHICASLGVCAMVASLVQLVKGCTNVYANLRNHLRVPLATVLSRSPQTHHTRSWNGHTCTLDSQATCMASAARNQSRKPTVVPECDSTAQPYWPAVATSERYTLLRANGLFARRLHTLSGLQFACHNHSKPPTDS